MGIDVNYLVKRSQLRLRPLRDPTLLDSGDTMSSALASHRLSEPLQRTGMNYQKRLENLALSLVLKAKFLSIF